MAKAKITNIYELVKMYDDKFVSSISLNGITSGKELKELLSKLAKANEVVTAYYSMLYNDFIMAANSDSLMPDGLEISTLCKYKDLANKIQRAYSYVLYVYTFENPFRSRRRYR